MRDTRMARRMSQAPPRMSIVFNTPISLNLELQDDPEEGSEEKQGGGKVERVKEFCYDNVKSIVTLIMILGMVFCIVMIVLVHKWNFEKTHGTDWNNQKPRLPLRASPSPVYSYLMHENFNKEDWEGYT